jgi:Uma2 family endonuclease
MRVKTPDSTLYTYPDIVVLRGPQKLEDTSFDTLLNPSLIVEVLSPSTEDYDRAKKFAYYRKIESLKEYVLVAQKECRVSQYTKQDSDTWIFHEATGLEETIQLESISCKLELRRVYRKIEFPPQDETRS